MTLSMGLTKGGSGKGKGNSQDSAQLILSVLLPVAVDLSTSLSRGAEAQAAGCMVLSAISAAFDLSTEATHSVVSSLATAASNKNIEGALVTAAFSIVQSSNAKKDSGAFPIQAARRLAQRPGFVDILRHNCRTYHFESSLVYFCDALGDILEQQSAEMVAEEKETLALLLEDILDFADAGVKVHVCKRLLRLIALKQVPEIVAALARCRQRQPAIIDEAIQQLTSGLNADKSAWSALSAVMAAQAGVTIKSFKSTKLWLGVNDTSPNSRKVAIEAMYSSIDKGETSVTDPMVKETVASRLSDDSALVLLALYSRPNVLLGNLKPEAIADGIASSMSLLQRDNEGQAVFAHASFLAQHVAGSSLKADGTILDALWPTLLFSEHNHETCSKIVDVLSALSKKQSDSFLFRVAESITKTTKRSFPSKNWQQVNADVALAIAEAVSSSDASSWQEHVDTIVRRLGQTGREENVRSRVLATMVLGKLIEVTEVGKRGRLAASILKDDTLVATAASKEGASTKACGDDFLAKVYKFTKPKQVLVWSQAILLVQIASGVPLESSFMLGSTTADFKTGAHLYEIANSSSTDVNLSKDMLQILFSRMGESALVFLANIWTSHPLPVVRFAALRHAKTFLSAFDENTRKIDFQTILPSFFVSLKSQEASIRREAISCLDLLASVIAKVASRTDSAPVETFGYDSLYGQKASENLKYLDVAGAKRLLDLIINNATALQHDVRHLDTLLKDSLTTSRGEAKADSKWKRAIVSFLASHIVAWGNLDARLLLLEAINGVADGGKLACYLPLLQNHIQSKANKTDRALAVLGEAGADAYLGFLFGAFDRHSRQALESDEDGVWTLFLQALESQQAGVQKHAALSLRERVFGMLSDEKSKQAYEVLLLCVSDPARSVSSDVRSSFASLNVSPSTFILVVGELRRSISSTLSAGPQAKKARVSDASSAGDQMNAASDRAAAILVEVLEVALARKATAASGALVAELFEVLRVGTEMVFGRLGNADYLMQLSMSCLSMLLDDQKQGSTSSGEVIQNIRADTIVNVVKSSSNPQTFQQALLLLSTVARLAPDTVLHNAMPIFTFVGSTMLQRDDSFSFTVIEKTMRSILPPLIASIRKRLSKGQDRLALLQESRSLLCVFTDAATHVPRHRRTIFFQLLVDIFGPKDFLSGICMLLVDRHARKVSKQSAADAQNTLALPLLVVQAYDAPTQLNALNDIWAEVQRGYEHRNDDAVEARSHLFLDSLSNVRSEHSGHRLEPARRMLALLKFITFASAQPSFAAKVEDERGLSDSQVIDEPLGIFTQHAIQTSLLGDAEIQRCSRDALDNVMSLASVDTLADVTKRLLSEVEPGRRQSGLDLVSDCLPSLTDASRREAASLLTPTVIETSYGLLWKKETGEALRLSCLAALRAIVSDCTASEHNALIAGVPGLVGLIKADAASIELRQSSLQLLAGQAKKLGPRIIPQLAMIVPTCALLIDEAIKSDEAALGVPAIGVLSSLCQAVPTFMVGYTNTIITLATREPIARFLIGKEMTSSKLASAFRSLLTMVARQLPFEKILNAVVELWQSTKEQSNKYMHTACLDILRRCMQRTKASRATIASTYKAVLRFLLRILDLRRTMGGQMAIADFDEIEAIAIGVFMQLVLKLNESAFRPLFLRIHDWAALDLVDDDEDERQSGKVWDHGLCARRLVLYKVTNALLDRLKELVSSYYSTVLDLSVELLDAFSLLAKSSDGMSPLKHERETIQALWLEVISSFEKSAKYDRGSFWNPARFAKTVPKVVDQLSLGPIFALSSGSGVETKAESAMTTKSAELLALTISRLAKAVPDEASLKLVNSKLLTQCRRSDESLLDEDEDEAEAEGGSKISRNRRRSAKVAALTATTTLWSQEALAQTILGLVPETVPHISEMLDDDDEKVRHEVSKLVEAVEGVLGEPLDSYLQ